MTLSENVSNGKINVNADLFISFFLNTPFHTAVLLKKKKEGLTRHNTSLLSKQIHYRGELNSALSHEQRGLEGAGQA